MNVLAIVGSPRKGKSTDTLVEKAIEGVRSIEAEASIKKLMLIEHEIKHCRNCLACRELKKESPVAKCAIRDDMDTISRDLLDSDALIFGTPVHMGYATGLMMILLERISWTFSKPTRRVLTVKGCPEPRSKKKRVSVTIITSGIVPPLYRRLCDQAAPLIKGVATDSLNARTVGDLYAGDIEHRGIDRYLPKAFRLGESLARRARQILSLQ